MSHNFYDNVKVYPLDKLEDNDVVTLGQLNTVKQNLLDLIEDVSGGSSADLTDIKTTINGMSGEIDDIKDRLEELGFKSGTITFAGTDYGSGLYKMGKCVYCNLKKTINFHTRVDNNTANIFTKYFMTKEQVDDLNDMPNTDITRGPIIQLEPGFLPAETTMVSIFIHNPKNNLYYAVQAEIQTNGTGYVVATASLPTPVDGYGLNLNVYLNFGFKIN